MRLPRVRMTLRRLMAVVAAVAVLLAVGVTLRKRSQAFDRIAHEHGLRTEMRSSASDTWGHTKLLQYYKRLWRDAQFHRRMYEKYRYAASHPWLPVEADPDIKTFEPGEPPRPYPWEPLPPYVLDRGPDDPLPPPVAGTGRSGR
jgi:hypothetical protein